MNDKQWSEALEIVGELEKTLDTIEDKVSEEKRKRIGIQEHIDDLRKTIKEMREMPVTIERS